MKKIKKIAALLLCIAVIVSSVGCSSENAVVTEPETTTSSSSDSDASSEDSAETDPPRQTEADETSQSAEASETSAPDEIDVTTAAAEESGVTSDSTERETVTNTVTSTEATTEKPSTTTTITTTTATTTTAAEVTTTTTAEVTTAEPINVEPTVYEAENAKLHGNLSAFGESGFSGGKAVGKFENDSDYIEFTVKIEQSGLYDLVFYGAGIGSDKENNVYIDGTLNGSVSHKKDKLSQGSLMNVQLSAGSHRIELKKSWGWIKLDCLEVKASAKVSSSVYNVSTSLINKNATAETVSLYKFLCDSYGKYVISGQVCDGGINGTEFKAIYKETGKYPAMLGLDMMRYTPSRTALGDRSDAVEKAIEFSKKGGIVTFCWHWNAPTEYLKSGNDPDWGSPRWWGGFYTRNTDINLSKIMNGQDAKGKELLDRDIKAIAEQLKRLEKAGVPVLWRPLHEASGGWFWWGASGADAYKKLWVYLYDQLTNVYKCNNLIWVYNGQSADWYPGDKYVDIIGEDIYPGERVYSPQGAKFSEAVDYSSSGKIVALTENGCIFDIDGAVSANVMWAWFCTWGGEYAANGSSYSEKYTEKSILKKAYSSAYVLTLDELPNLKNYR